LVIALCLLLAVPIILLGELRLFAGSPWFGENAIPAGYSLTEGSVSAFRPAGSSGLAPVVTYRVDGQTYSIVADDQSRTRPYTVAYDPDDPRAAKLVDNVGGEEIIAFMILLPIASVVGLAWVLTRYWRRKDVGPSAK